VTSLSAELGRHLGVQEAADACEPHLRDLFAWNAYDRSADLSRDEKPARVPYRLHPLPG
jgi:hypothetical protein